MPGGGKQQQQQRDAKRMQPLKPPSNISAFLSKLWRMVNDHEVDALISWNESGTCFIIQNQYLFWADLLPVYYKHNNMASFVRQLNMYGFHKVTSDSGVPESDLQFYHEYFQRDKPDLLEKIKRKVAVPRPPSTVASRADGGAASSVVAPSPTTPASQINFDKQDLARVLTDVKDIQGRQSTFNNQLVQLKHENSVLWSELAMLRQRHTKQQAIVNKLIHFLVTLVQTPNSANHHHRMGVKRRTFPLMIDDHDHNVNAAKKAKTGGRRRGARAHGGRLRIHELDPDHLDLDPDDIDMDIDMDIGEAIDEDSVNTLETVRTSQPYSPSTTTARGQPFSPEAFLHSPPKHKSQSQDEVNDVVIDESTALVDKLLDNDDNDEIIVLPSDIKSPCGTDIADTCNADLGIGSCADVDVDDESDNGSEGGGFLFNSTAASNKLVSNLMNGGSYNSSAISDMLRSKLAASLLSSGASTSAAASAAEQTVDSASSAPSAATVDTGTTAVTPSDYLALATMSKPPKPPQRLKSVVSDELGQHVKETQSELDSIKDIIYGSNGMDLNYLLGLFTEEPPFKLVPQQNPGNFDPNMLSTISTYDPIGSPIDFGELIDSINSDSADPMLSISAEEENTAADATNSSINTPLIFEGAPIFPSTSKK